jgi:N-acetylglucosaminyl-diphospho-decaprenol L-rhamnosyltransferase
MPARPTREQVAVDVLHREPLKMHDIRLPCGALVEKHVWNVLDELGDTLRAGTRGKARGAVEQLAPPVPLGERDGTVGEATREQLDLGPLSPQRAAQRVVIRRCVGGGIDDLDTHRKDNRRACGDNAQVTHDEPTHGDAPDAHEIELTYCVVNTSQRELLLRGLDAIARERESLPFATEVLVLDNGSRDGSAEAAREHPTVDQVIAQDERRGKALNDSKLLRRARGRYALLLNEDSELLPGASLSLYEALAERPDAALAGAALQRPDGSSQPSAWRFPTAATALVGALFLHRRFTVQSTGGQIREVDWCQSAALLVRRAAAEQVDYLDPDFFVYSDEVDFARRLRDVSWYSVYVPAAVAIHHEQLSTDVVPERRIVELARNRDLYMRKHHSPTAARTVRWLTAWTYLLRALAALVLPGHSGGRDSHRYWRHVTATLHPNRGEGLREAAEEYNRS